MASPTDAERLEALTDFLYLVPVGLLQFGMAGAVELINPLAAQLLLPLANGGDWADAYSALAPLVPDLACQVHGFGSGEGVILDHLRCEVLSPEPRVLSLTVHRIYGPTNLAIIEDVTQLAEQERRLFADRQRFRAIFDHVRDYAIYTVDLAGRIDEWNQSLHRFGGWDPEDVVGRPLGIFFPDAERGSMQTDCLLSAAGQTGSVETEGWRLRKDGSRLWANTVLTALPDAGGIPRGFVVVSRDMTERKRLEDELRRLATTDALTGAFNRRYGQMRLAAAFRALTGLGVLMLDIDHFKSINDRYGHGVGDAALCAVVASCQRALGEAGVVVRWGGEEFLVLLTGTGTVAARALAEDLRATVAAVRVPVPSGELSMTVSIGVAVAAASDGTEDALVERADAALYTAKRDGRNRVVAAD